jgi:hypothetical protein
VLPAALALLAGLALAADYAAAQEQPSTEGVLTLLLPTGARAVGMGQAVTAEQGGSESLWWNPAGLAHAERREAAIHHSKTIAATGDAVSLVIPASIFGVVALSANILNYGEQEVTDSTGSLGTLLPRDLTYAATYSSPVGSHGSVGITYKIIQARFDCSGACASVPAQSGASSALDLGAQFALAPRLPLTLGVAVRNVGPRLQLNDRDQADPLPSRLHLGMALQRPITSAHAPGLVLTVTGDAVGELRSFDNRTYRLGSDLTWRERVHLRAGYAFDRTDVGGPSLGFGVTSGNFAVDFARIFRGLSAEVGQAPTYLSLRYLF